MNFHNQLKKHILIASCPAIAGVTDAAVYMKAGYDDQGNELSADH